MNFEPNTSLHLSLPNNELNLDLNLDQSSSSSSPPLSCLSEVPRVFSCTYCRRKFYSSQALGGHQNAHKLERTLAKKSRELSRGSNRSTSPKGHVRGSNLRLDHEGDVGRTFGNDHMSLKRMEMHYCDTVGHRSDCYRPENHAQVDDFGQLDLSLRL